MPTLVHIADERDSTKIISNGLKIGKWRKGIFFMPITQDFYVSHQWLRELKRRGIRTFVGVYFKLSSNELVWFGKYHEGHKKLTLREALAEFMKAEDKLGFEFLLERKIESKEIERVRHLPQTLGWRYMPNSHSRGLSCACPMCISPGEINSRKKREKLEPKVRTPTLKEIIEALKIETDELEIDRLFGLIRRKKRRIDPELLRFIIDSANTSAIRAFALTLEYFKHRNSIKILTELCNFKDEEVREYSAEGLIKLDKKRGLQILSAYLDDHVISKIVESHSTAGKKCI